MQSIGRQNNLRKIAGPVAGILVLLAAVFLAASLCSAASSPRISRIFKPRVAKLGSSLPGQTRTGTFQPRLSSWRTPHTASAGRSDLISKPSR